MVSPFISVRPTKRCMADLGVNVPDLGVLLHEIDDSIVATAQSVPEKRDAGGVERVRSLKDRVWFKVKTSDRRAVAAELSVDDLPDWVEGDLGSWWIGAAGRRQKDSPQRDFYAVLQQECTTGRTTSTDRLLPSEWDWKRLGAEQAVAWRREMKRTVIRLISMSLKSGQVAVAEFRRHRIKALVRAEDGHEAYLAIVAEGVPDPEMFALLLDCVPGVGVDEWQPEPSPLAEMTPLPGEIIWSTLFPPEVAAAILEPDDD